MSGIRTRAMTVGLHISRWGAQRLDRKVTNEVIATHNAAKDAGKFHKLLVPEEAIKPTQQAETAARAKLYELTLPWHDGSVRILSAEMFFDFRKTMRECETTFWSTVDTLESAYPTLYLEAPQRLNGMFNPRDFPRDTADLRSRFAFRLTYDPLPDAGDWRIDMDDDVIKELTQTAIEGERTRLGEANKELLSRLFTELKHFTTTMSTKDKVFRDTTVTNLISIAELAPKMNLAGDPVIDQLGKEIVKMLKDVDPETLRTDKNIRAHTADEARAKLAKLERAMGVNAR